MPVWLQVLLDIIKLTVPGLIVFFTVRTMLKQYFAHQQTTELRKLQKGKQEHTLPLRLQAYERLSLFCERISLSGLILRTRQEGMNAAQLRIALLLAIQQEFEHNITQQVYVSDQLWQIIKIARDDAVQVITQACEVVDLKADARKLAEAIIHLESQRDMSASEKALVAVKKEAGILCGLWADVGY